MLQVDPKQSYLNLKIGLPPVPKAGSSGTVKKNTIEPNETPFTIKPTRKQPLSVGWDVSNLDKELTYLVKALTNFTLILHK